MHKKRRRITSCYTYSSHGLFYALFLLIYGMRVFDGTSAADTFNQARQLDGKIDSAKALNQLVASVNSDSELESEYYDGDADQDYLNLISNKSGKYAR